MTSLTSTLRVISIDGEELVYREEYRDINSAASMAVFATVIPAVSLYQCEVVIAECSGALKVHLPPR